MSRWVSWAAVSSLPQAKLISLSDQLAGNKAHIDRHGGTLVAELVVPGESRNIILFEDACAKMDAYAQLRDLIVARAFDVLVCLDRSRLGRKASLSMTIVELCNDAQIVVYETEAPPASIERKDQTIDAQLVGAIKSVMAQEEIQKFRRRHALGMRGRILRGQHPNQPPYGYQVAYAADGAQIVTVDEDAAQAIRLIAAWYLDGYSIKAIGDRLLQAGYYPPVSDSWRVTSLCALLDRIWTYAGFAEYGYGRKARRRGTPKLRHPAQWEAIIDQATAAAVEVERARRKPIRRATGAPNLFSQMCICDTCGSLLNREHRARGSGSYMCPNHCPGSYIRQQYIADALTAAIDYLGAAANLEAVAALAGPDPIQSQRAKLEAAQRHLASLAGQRERLTLSYMRQTISPAEYESLMAPLAAERAAAEAAIADLETLIAAVPDPATRHDRLADIRDAGHGWLHSPDVPAANAWLRRHFRVYVKDNQVSAARYLV